jgi:PAS domain S-box-containing protein
MMDDNLIRERDFYRQQCNQLGARLAAAIEAQARARREANRSRTTARLVRDIYRLADAEVSLVELGQHFLQIILEAMRVDRVALLNYQPETNRFVTWFSLGFCQAEPDFTPPEPPAEFYFANSTNPTAPELAWLRQAAGGPYLLWTFNSTVGLALLMSNDTEDQHTYPPFEAADQEIVEGALSVLVDIIKRKRTEQALQQSEQKYRLLAENVKDVIWTTDLNFRFTFVSPSVVTLSGYTAAETLDQTIDQILTESSLAIAAEVLAREMARESSAEPVDPARSVILELEQIRKDGSIIPVEVRAGFLRDGAGQPIGILGVSRDITERRQVEAALRESEQKYRQLVQYAPAGIYEIDFVRQKLISVNDVMCEYTGYSREELLALSPFDLLTDESKSLFAQRLQQGLQGQALPEDVEYKIKAKNGQEYWVLLNARWRYQDDRPVGATVVVHNITERKLIEEQIKASLHEKRVLLQEIHHRVKNNLQIISSLLSLQSATVQAPEVLHSFLDSQHRIRSMALIHEKLYRSENLAQIDFADYIRDLTAYLWRAHSAAERGISLNVQAEGILIKIDTAVPCGLILNELVSNALKHAFPEGRTGQIDIELKQENQHLCLMVGDNGVGLPANFDLGQTGSLGLQLVGTLTSQLNGTLEQNSNHGAQFRITFSLE